ncbi:MAG: xylulokinase [candidate division NC10 bacterium]|nr:xylulokinase [candidate division NC10 bacterium]
MGLLLGTDIGAQSLKVALFDEGGSLLALERIQYPIERPQPGWAEEHPEVWWESFCRAVRSALDRRGVCREEIESVGISTMCPSLVALDGEGNPLRPAILYLDQRSLPQAHRIEKEIGLDKIFQLTGNRIAPGTYSVTSMLWIQENEPQVFRRTRFFGHGNTFLAHRLTGQFAFDWTNASFTGLFETGTHRTWSRELCASLHLSEEMLPEPVISSARVGTLGHEASRATGLVEGIPVAIGGADTACSALGAGVTDPGQVFETSGTSDVLSFCADQPLFDIRFMNRCHVVPDRWLLMGAMLSPGAALSWFKDQFCAQEQEMAQKLALSAYQIMDLESESSPPGCNGLIFLPYMRGERSPVWNPYARGVFFGLSLESTKADVIRSMLEGTAYGLRQNLEIGEKLLQSAVKEIRAVGGGAKSKVWSQIKADILKRPLTLLDQQETAVTGAAMLGGLASGRFANYQEAALRASAHPWRVFSPNPDLGPLYDQMYASYLALYQRLDDLFEKVSKISPRPT